MCFFSLYRMLKFIIGMKNHISYIKQMYLVLWCPLKLVSTFLASIVPKLQICKFKFVKTNKVNQSPKLQSSIFQKPIKISKQKYIQMPTWFCY